MPPPTRISGRSARAINAAARAMSARSGRMRREGARNVVGSIAKSSAAEVVLAVADVLRHVEQHRSRPARGRHREGAAQQFGNTARLLDPDQLLDRRPQDFDLAAFLGHVLPGMAAVGVAGKRHHRRSGVQRLDQAGDQIGGAGPEGAVAHPRPVGDPGIGLGGKGAAALVVDQEVPAGRAAPAHRRTATAESRPCRTSARPRRAAASRPCARPPFMRPEGRLLGRLASLIGASPGRGLPRRRGERRRQTRARWSPARCRAPRHAH